MMKLSPKQKEVVEYLKKGWRIGVRWTFVGHNNKDVAYLYEKEGGHGNHIKINMATFKSLKKMKLIEEDEAYSDMGTTYYYLSDEMYEILTAKKKINTMKKGLIAVNERVKQLREDGWLTDTKQQGRGANKDYFGMFDIFAFKGNRIRLEQVKCNTTQGAIKKIREWIENNDVPDFIEYYMTIRVDGAGAKPVKWRIKQIKEEN